MSGYGNPRDQRNWIERLSSHIPGYGGYVEKERRRDTDKLQREHLADRIRGFRTPIGDVMRDLTNNGRLFEVGPLDHLLKKLERIENRIRFASYGYAGFFDVVKVDDARLEQIYQADLALVQEADQVEGKVAAVKTSAGSADTLKSAASDLDTALDQFEKTFEARFNAVNTYGAGQAQGETFFSPQGPGGPPTGTS